MKLLVIGREGRLDKYTRNKQNMEGLKIVYATAEQTEAELLSIGGDADFILADAISTVSGNLIRQMPNLRLIHSEGVAFNRIDTEAAKERGIYVCNCKGMNATAVAEQTILLMLGLLRGVCKGDRSVRKGTQITTKEAYMIHGDLKELGECTIGLIGFGDIAQATARFAGAFGCRILYYKPRPASAELETALHAEYRDLDTLLAESDIVSLHLPVTEETIHSVNRDFLKKMKKDAYLINTSRGELIDAEALVEALENDELAGAGLDTLEGEPVQKDNPLVRVSEKVKERTLLSCHIGGITAASFMRGYDMVWEDLNLVRDGKRPHRIVNGL